jgi:hypothetical protein
MECRHEVDTDEYDCMNCDNDIVEFDVWWEKHSGWGGEKLAEYNLAKAAWFRAIQYMVEDHSLGL